MKEKKEVIESPPLFAGCVSLEKRPTDFIQLSYNFSLYIDRILLPKKQVYSFISDFSSSIFLSLISSDYHNLMLSSKRRIRDNRSVGEHVVVDEWYIVVATGCFGQVHSRRQLLAVASHQTALVEIEESGEMRFEAQSDITHSTISVFGNDNLCDAFEVVAIGILVDFIVLRTVDKAYDVGILLDGSRLTQVAELWSFAVGCTLWSGSHSVLHTTVQLAQRDDGDVEFLGQSLERTRDGGYFLLSAVVTHAAGVHQLQVVYNDEFNIMFAHQSACFRTEFEDR